MNEKEEEEEEGSREGMALEGLLLVGKVHREGRGRAPECQSLHACTHDASYHVSAHEDR